MKNKLLLEIADVIDRNFGRLTGIKAAERIESFMKDDGKDNGSVLDLIPLHNINNRIKLIDAVTEMSEILEKYLSKEQRRAVEKTRSEISYDFGFDLGDEDSSSFFKFSSRDKNNMFSIPKQPSDFSDIWNLFATPIEGVLRKEGYLCQRPV